MLTDGWTHRRMDDGQKVITIDHPEHSSGELKKIFQMSALATILDFTSEQFQLFLIYKSPRCFLISVMSTGLSFQEKKRKIDFQDGGHGGHLGYYIGTTLAIIALQDTLMLPTKFKVNWPFGSGEEANKRAQRALIHSLECYCL